jgi:hypothetical protein
MFRPLLANIRRHSQKYKEITLHMLLYKRMLLLYYHKETYKIKIK